MRQAPHDRPPVVGLLCRRAAALRLDSRIRRAARRSDTPRRAPPCRGDSSAPSRTPEQAGLRPHHAILRTAAGFAGNEAGGKSAAEEARQNTAANVTKLGT